MIRIVKLLAVLATLLPAAAAAQSQLPTMPAGTVLGRTGILAGPAQAIPFAQLASQLAGSFGAISPNLVNAGPTSGSPANPTFRALVGADLPVPSASTLGGVESYAAVTHQWINAISTAGAPSSTQPAIADISGWGTGVAAALGVNIGSAGAPVLFNGAGGTPSSMTLTNATGLPLSGLATAPVTEQKNTFGTGLTSSGNCDNTSTNASSPCNAAVSLSIASNILGGDVALNSTTTFFDGPSMAQGTSGTWFVHGTVTLTDTSAAATFWCKLWDGTTVISSGASGSPSAGNPIAITLVGTLASPAANIRISCVDKASTSGAIKFNVTGNSKDSSIFGVRIQ